jgi:hypothetical protein
VKKCNNYDANDGVLAVAVTAEVVVLAVVMVVLMASIVMMMMMMMMICKYALE